jgi:hypothetical protein
MKNNSNYLINLKNPNLSSYILENKNILEQIHLDNTILFAITLVRYFKKNKNAVLFMSYCTQDQNYFGHWLYDSNRTISDSLIISRIDTSFVREIGQQQINKCNDFISYAATNSDNSNLSILSIDNILQKIEFYQKYTSFEQPFSWTHHHQEPDVSNFPFDPEDSDILYCFKELTPPEFLALYDFEKQKSTNYLNSAVSHIIYNNSSGKFIFAQDIPLIMKRLDDLFVDDFQCDFFMQLPEAVDRHELLETSNLLNINASSKRSI